MENEIILSKVNNDSVVVLDKNAEHFIESFLSDLDATTTTKDTYRKSLRQFFRWHRMRGGGDLARTDIPAFKQDQLKRMQASSVSSYLTAVKSLFKWLA